jgi:hypothetical protein
MERSGVFEVTPEERTKSFPKCTKETGIMVRDNVRGDTKMSEKEICNLRRSISLSEREKMAILEKWRTTTQMAS